MSSTPPPASPHDPRTNGAEPPDPREDVRFEEHGGGGGDAPAPRPFDQVSTGPGEAAETTTITGAQVIVFPDPAPAEDDTFASVFEDAPERHGADVRRDEEHLVETAVFVSGEEATPTAPTRSLGAGRSGGGSGVHRLLRGGTVIAGRYRIDEKIGQGGMGEVYVADRLDPAAGLPPRVVIKVPRSKYYGRLDVLECFYREGKHQQRVVHPFVARVFEVGRLPLAVEEFPEHPGLPYIVTEFIDGTPLDEYCLARSSELTVGDVIDLFAQVAEALDATMAMNIVHRDIKPQNILVIAPAAGAPAAPPPEGPEGAPASPRASVRLLDFGLALDEGMPDAFLASVQQLTSGSETDESSERGGTPAFMPPEMWEGRGIGIAADIYALAIAIYMSLTRSYPYIIRGYDYRSAHMHFLPIAPGSYNPQFTQAMDDALLAGLAKNPAMRPERPSAYIDGVRRAFAAAAMLERPLDWLTQHSMPTFDSGEEHASFPTGTGVHARLWSVDDLQRLRHISLFRGLSKGELLTMLNAGLLSEIPARRLLFRKGDHADRLYAILEGEVEVFLPPAEEGGAEESLAHVGSGAVFGEIGLILGGERNASVRTLSAVRALVIGKAELDLLLARPQRASTALMLNIARSVARTLQAAEERARRSTEALRARVAELEAALAAAGGDGKPT